MKAVKLLFVVFFLLLTLTPSFSEQRNLSTPLSRLWGHWVDVKTGDQYYIAKVTKTDESGSFIMVTSTAAYAGYRVLSQELSGKMVKIAQTFMGTTIICTCLIEKNGNTMEFKFDMTGDKILLKYVDSKTTPEG